MPELEVEQVEVFPEFAGGFIFNSPKFLSMKSGNHLLFVLNSSDNPVARIWFKVEGKRAVSGVGATFGSIDSSIDLSANLTAYFLKEVVDGLIQQNYREIIIRHWPDAYSEEHWRARFLENRFTVKSSEVNQHLVVTEKSFTFQLRYNEQKKLNQAQTRGFDFRVLSVSELKVVYDLVKETRLRKDYPVSMSLAELQNAFKKMPDEYLLFGLYDDNKLIAASVSIRVAADILYNFYHADDFTYRSVSPMVMLVGKIYEYCQTNGIRLLDLGISSVNGILNEGLYNFKKNLGCATSEKNTYLLKR